MNEGWGKRAVLVACVLLAAVNVAVWSGVFKRRPPAPIFAVQAGGSSQPAGSPSPRTSGSPAPIPTDLPSGLAPGLATLPIPLPAPTGRALTVSIVGDTLATGRYASSPDTRYRSLVLAALQRARGSVTAEEAVPTHDAAVSTAVTVPSGDDLVILELGTDDLRRTDAAGFSTSYGDLVKAVRASSPDAALVCAGTWTAHTHPPGSAEAFDTIIQRDCLAARGTYVPLQPLYDDSANRGPAGVTGFYGVSDDTAPNDAGHRAIAGALLAALGLSLS